MNRLKKARAFAVKAHGKQRYGKTQPYSYHLDAVVAVLKEFEVDDEDILVAGYLHDVLEDTPTTEETLAEEFGDRVSLLVDAVTDGEGYYRRDRKQRPYKMIPKIPGALTVKLADRLSNMREALDSPVKEYITKYVGEHEDFFANLHPDNVEHAQVKPWDLAMLKAMEDIVREVNVPRYLSLRRRPKRQGGGTVPAIVESHDPPEVVLKQEQKGSYLLVALWRIHFDGTRELIYQDPDVEIRS